MKLCIKILIVILCIMLICGVMLSFSFQRINFNADEIMEISYTNYLEEFYTIKYNEYDEIKRVVHDLSKIIFLTSKESKLQESPISNVSVKYIDGHETHIDMSGYFLIHMYDQDSEGKLIANSSEFYYSLFGKIRKCFE